MCGITHPGLRLNVEVSPLTQGFTAVVVVSAMRSEQAHSSYTAHPLLTVCNYACICDYNSVSLGFIRKCSKLQIIQKYCENTEHQITKNMKRYLGLHRLPIFMPSGFLFFIWNFRV